MKNILVAIVAVLIFNAVFVYSGGLELLVKTEQKTEAPVEVHPDVVGVFKFALEDEVQKKRGVPIEGYEPYMFLEVFPGLVATDFDGVEASIGTYRMVDGRLKHVPNEDQLLHSAATAVSREGMETLLYNVTDRIGVDLTNDGTITEVIEAIVAE